MNTRTSLRVVVICNLVLASTASTHAVLSGYQASSSTNSTLWEIALETGTQTPIGVTGVTAIRALDISPLDGKLYGVSFYDLYSLNIETGLATLVAKDVFPYGAKSIAFAPDGSLSVINSVSGTAMLYRIDVSSGSATTVGSLSPYTNVTAFAANSSGDGIAWSKDSNWLFHIDLANASTTSLGPLSGGGIFEAFDYGPDNILYGSTYSHLYSIDVDNLQTNYLSSFSNTDSMYGFCVVPEPTTLSLLALGGLALLRRRGKRGHH